MYIYIDIGLKFVAENTECTIDESRSFNIETIRNYHQDIMNLKKKYHEKQQKYKNAYDKLLHVSTGASSVGVISGI